jgi:hypothetical protein
VDGMTQGDVLGVLHESGTGKEGVTPDGIDAI